MATTQKPPEKKVEKVVTGNVTIKKKSALVKIRDMFIAEDADKVGNYILMDVLVPSIKKAIVDIIKSSADMIFGTKGSQKSGGTTRIALNPSQSPNLLMSLDLSMKSATLYLRTEQMLRRSLINLGSSLASMVRRVSQIYVRW